jgi:hypothetical protein
MWELPGAVRRLVCCGERLSRPKLMQVTTCGLCGGDPTTRGLHKDFARRLLAMVSPRSQNLS